MKTVAFYFPDYDVSGVPVLFSNLADYFSKNYQFEISIIDFASGDYPIGEKVKILYNKDSKPVTELDSADFYRIVKFKGKNIPLGVIRDYYLNDTKQNKVLSNKVQTAIEWIKYFSEHNY